MENTKKVLLINTHLTYPNWTEGKLNNAFIQVAKDFFTTKSFQVLETKVEDGYNPEEEVEKHLEADIVILQMPVNWFGAPWIYKKYVDEVFNSGLHSQKFLSSDGHQRESTIHFENSSRRRDAPACDELAEGHAAAGFRGICNRIQGAEVGPVLAREKSHWFSRSAQEAD